jgi:hypothetical protein
MLQPLDDLVEIEALRLLSGRKIFERADEFRGDRRKEIVFQRRRECLLMARSSIYCDALICSLPEEERILRKLGTVVLVDNRLSLPRADIKDLFDRRLDPVPPAAAECLE